jgi:hypothetical protein
MTEAMLLVYCSRLKGYGFSHKRLRGDGTGERLFTLVATGV